jgi:TRAP-type transport system small permease protein
VSESLNQADSQPGNKPSQAGTEDKVSKTVQKIFSGPVKVMVGISSVLLIAVMLLVTTDVTGRYIFKHPITGSDELVGLFLLCAAACAFSYTQKEHRHVRIDLLIDRLAFRSRLVFDIINLFLAVVITALISWQVFIAARKLYLNLQGGTQLSETLGIPWLPFMIILGLGFAIFALVLMGDLIIALVKVARR